MKIEWNKKMRRFAAVSATVWLVIFGVPASSVYAACDVDASGTYIDAENFTGTIVQGTGTFAVDAGQAGYLGTGALLSSGGAGNSCPAVDEGKSYQVNFPTAGTYNLWIRAWSQDGASDSVLAGIDGMCAGAISTGGVHGAWTWSGNAESGVSTVSVATPGVHTLNLWVREPNFRVDGIYLDTAGNTPTDLAYGVTIDPVTDCSALGYTVTRCDQCHPFPPIDTATRAVPEGSVVGSHETHNILGVSCESCHGDTTTGRTNLGHRDGKINIAAPLNGETGSSYSSGTSFDQINDIPGAGLGSCDGLMCHSVVQTDTGGALTGLPGEFKQPAWGGAVACGDCHLQSPTSGSHGAHLSGGTKCGDCHHGAGTGVTSPVADHGNALINLRSDMNYTQGAQHAPGDGFGNCSTQWCHSSSVVTWGGTVNCDACHGYPPTLGAHLLHVNLLNIDPTTDLYAPSNAECEKCHDMANPAATHTSGAADVSVSMTYSLDGTAPVYDPVAKTCSNVSCHYREVGWYCAGDGGTTCVICHDTGPTSGSHSKHATEGAACGDCHDGAVWNLQPPAGHRDENVEVFDQTPGDLGWSGASCNSALCHSDGVTPVQTPDWGTPYSGCDMCHAVVPTTGAHTSHMAHPGTVCGDCHTGAIEGTTPPTSGHRNDIREADQHGYNVVSQQCSNATCHTSAQDDGGTSVSITVTPDWFTSPNCGECHDAVPNTGNHFHVGLSNTYGGGAPIVCSDCHPGAGDGSTLPAANHHDGNINLVATVNYDQGATHPVLNGYGNCTTTPCHTESRLWGGGESIGGLYCGGCHSDLAKRMEDSTAGMVYKHFLNAAVGTDAVEETIGQPAIMGDALDTRRKCLICHADHDKWSPKVGGSANDRSRNLRANVSELPTTVTTTNTDFSPTDTYGGLCMSCHIQEQPVKAVQTPNAVTHVPPIPFSDLDDPTRAPDGLGTESIDGISVFAAATHAYSAKSGAFSDGTKFEAVCLKCHNDTMPKAKSGVPEPAFGIHQSSKNSFFAAMGTGNFKDYAYGLVTNVTTTTITVDTDLIKDYTNFALVVTRADGSQSQREIITATGFAGGAGTDTVTVAAWTAFTPSVNDHYEITRDVTPIEEICFNCHSQGGDGIDPWANGGGGYKLLDGTDYYGGLEPLPADRVEMQDRLEGIHGLFVGFNHGSIDNFDKWRASNVDNLVICDEDLAGTGPPDDPYWIGYQVRFRSGPLAGLKAEIIDGGNTGNLTRCPNGEQNWIQVVKRRLSTPAIGDRYEILKPAFHPLDTFGIHEPGEFEHAPMNNPVDITQAWNAGDMGSCSASVDATHCRDAEWNDASQSYVANKDWKPGGFAGLSLHFVNGDCQGKGEFPLVGPTYNTEDTMYFDTTGVCLPAEGDQYILGHRHVSCADCHNTHAAEVNPSGATSGVIQASQWVDAFTMEDLGKTTAKTGWAADHWKGYLLMITDWLTQKRQVRQIISSTTDATKTTYTVGVAFTAPLPSEFTYEVVRLNGDTGSGGRGVWGVDITGYNPTSGPEGDGAGQDPSTLTFTRYYDTGRDAPVGTKTGKQYMQCMRCHSYYGYADSPPTTPSGYADHSVIAETDISQEINPHNYAHHAIEDIGNNQPIPSDGSTLATLNPNWPTLTGTATITDGVVSFATGLPETALPGWFVRLDTGGNWYQITEVASTTAFTIASTSGNPWDPAAVSTGINYSGNITITAGLGNAFVPPYGPWEIIRCTECHGARITEALGPHASTNKWLLRDAVVDLVFQWWNGSTVVDVDYTAIADQAAGTYALNDPSDSQERYLCFNCHRADVYGPKYMVFQSQRPVNETQSRISHGEMWAADGDHLSKDGYDVGQSETYWPQYCRHCHAGDKLGGIHGTWTNGVFPDSAGASSDLGPMGKRFMNGATWDQYRPVAGKCYTISNRNAVSACRQHTNGSNFTFNFNYDYTD